MAGITVADLFEKGLISNKLRRVLSLLGCESIDDMVELSNNSSRLDYLHNRHSLKEEFLNALNNIVSLPDFSTSEFLASKRNEHPLTRVDKDKKFKVGDFSEKLLSDAVNPIKIDDLLLRIKEFLPGTYIESIRANLCGDPQDRFVFFLDGYVGLKNKKYDKRYQPNTIANKKRQYAEARILEFMSFIEQKHRSPQPHGLEEEESLYRWYLYFLKTNAKETRDIRESFLDYLKEYEQWIYSPYEYSYKRNCDHFQWYVEENVELPTENDEPELISWFNFQLDYHHKYKDKRKKMFEDLLVFLSDYGIHFYDAKSAKGKEAIKINAKYSSKSPSFDTPIDKYSKIFFGMSSDENSIQEYLLLLAIGNMLANNLIKDNIIYLSNELLTEFADTCIDNVGTASSYNIAVPFFKLNEQQFWSLVPKENIQYEEIEAVTIPSFDFLEKRVECAIIDQELVNLFLDPNSATIIISYLSELISKPYEVLGNEIPRVSYEMDMISTGCAIKDAFKQYLYGRCGEKTANSYISCLQNSVFEHARCLFDSTLTSIFELDTRERAEKCFAILMTNNKFIEDNKISHNKFTAVFKHYLSFLDSYIQ